MDPSPALRRYPWLRSHPHLSAGWPTNNTVYVARERLELTGHAVAGFRVTRAEYSGSPPPHQRSRLLWATPKWLDPLGVVRA